MGPMSSYLEQIKSWPRDTRLFLFYNLFAFVGWGVFQLIFNLYCVELGYRENDLGVFQAAQTVAMAIAAVAMGPVIRRSGAWGSMVGAIAIFTVSSFFMAWAENFWLLAALSALSGVGLAYLFNSIMPYIIEWTPREHRANVAAIVFAVTSLSGTVGSLVGGYLPDTMPISDLWSYRWTLVIGTLIAGVGIIPLLLMRDTRGENPVPEVGAQREAESKQERRQVRTDVAVFVAIGGIMALGAGMVIPFYNVYLTDLGARSGTIGLVFAVGGFASAIFGLAAPMVQRRFGAIPAVATIRLAGLPLFAMLIFLPALPIAIAAHIVRQITINLGWPIDSTFIAEVLPPSKRASVYGLRSASWNLLWALASLIGGFVIVRFGYAIPFATLVITGLVAIVLFVVYYGRHPRVRSGDLPSALPRGRSIANRARQEAA